MDVNGPYWFNPDSDGYYWQLSGTSTYTVYQLGCYENVVLQDNLDINAIRCDAVGDKDVVVKRNHLELRFDLKSFFPLANIAPVVGGSAVTTNLSQHTEKMGMGVIDTSKYYKVYFPKVYDQTAGDYVSITGHRCKFVSNGEWRMTFGQVWTLPVTLWLMADENKPTAQAFATIVRSDFSAI